MMRTLNSFIACCILCISCGKSSNQNSVGTTPSNPSTPTFDSTAIRGVWVTTAASTALNSKDNIKQVVANCKLAGINNIFMAVYDNARTTYPSTVMQNLIGVPILESFSGRDPLKEMIDEAHANNIKVYAWFEYGFAASYSANGGPIIQAKPNWAAKDVNLNLVTKNGFDWLNAFLPEVQDYLMSLIKEVVNNYNVDGIQGDDRLPALPSSAGYDDYTVALFKAQNAGALPPTNYADANWVNWRAKQLNLFMKRIFTEVKALKPSIKISMAPSVYPWSLQEYLQDWPTWVDSSWVDAILPQVYRYDIASYTSTLSQQKTYLKNKTSICYPGVLLQSGTYVPSDLFLTQMLQENRNEGFKGESFFFYEGIKSKMSFFQTQYPYIQ